MEYNLISSFIESCKELCKEMNIASIRWCDVDRFKSENMEGVAPGGFINPFNYYVIGTTIGGNAIVVNPNKNEVFFADHSWYSVDICYKDLGGDKEYHCFEEFNQENIDKSLFVLSNTKEEFILNLKNGSLEKIIDEIG